MKLRWTRRALADLERIAARTAADKPAAMAGFVDALHDKVKRLQRFPLLGRVAPYGDTRELVVHRNYLVTYRVRGDEVHVLQVWHAAQHRLRG